MKPVKSTMVIRRMKSWTTKKNHWIHIDDIENYAITMLTHSLSAISCFDGSYVCIDVTGHWWIRLLKWAKAHIFMSRSSCQRVQRIKQQYKPWEASFVRLSFHPSIFLCLSRGLPQCACIVCVRLIEIDFIKCLLFVILFVLSVHLEESIFVVCVCVVATTLLTFLHFETVHLRISCEEYCCRWEVEVIYSALEQSWDANANKNHLIFRHLFE